MRIVAAARAVHLLGGLVCGAGLGLALGPVPAWAALATISAETASMFSDAPLTGTSGVAPLVMLTVSRDHQLHYKAYNDYTDLDGDGVLDTTYKNSISYYGYFDSAKCYVYSTANGRFEPSSAVDAASGKCNAGSASGQWSGNFLNWASMTRMDAVRKLLYGGLRSADSATLTVLERSYLPADAHAFAKYYNGSDIAQLTPFTNVATTPAAYPNTAGAISAAAYAPIGIASISISGSTATITTSVAHGYISGESVFVTGACQVEYNGIQTPITVIDPTTFSYTVGGSPDVCDAGGSAQLLLRVTPSATAPVALGDQISLVLDASNYMSFVVTSLLNASGNGIAAATSGTVYIRMTRSSFSDDSNIVVTGSGSSTALTLTDLNTSGVSFCNVTPGATSGSNNISQTNTAPPILKVARGNYALWSANERDQCYWYNEATVNGHVTSDQQGPFGGGLRSNGNRAADSGIPASAENPIQNVDGLGSGSGISGTTATSATGQYIVRVKACVPGLIGNERCKAYPATNGTYPTGVQKPVGLLQVYGDENRIYFGLLTGSYDKNISGGQLRNNADTLNNEINYNPLLQTGDGTFLTGVTNKGLIWNLNRLRLYGYNYSQGGYMNSDACVYQLTGLVLSGGQNTGGYPQNQGNCSSWGNPVSEAYVESLRYFGGKTATADFGGTTLGSKDNALGLTVATWSDPLSNQNYCASLNILDFNASVSSYDDDQATGLADLAPDSTTSPPSIAAWTRAVGDDEGITGTGRFVGNNGALADLLCTVKNISDLSLASGICPEAPTFKGTYLIDGAAYYSHTNRIRTSLPTCTAPFAPNAPTNLCSGTTTVGSLTLPDADPSLKVDTYGIQLASNVPRIPISVTVNGAVRTVTIQPAYRLTVRGTVGPGTLVDFKLVSQDATSGKFYINWEDSGQGGDYDQDEWGTISYCLSDALGNCSATGSNLRITTDAIAASTANGQGFGYIVTGTTQDGPHFHSGIYGFNYTDPGSVGVTVYRADTGAAINGTTPFVNGADAGGNGGINASGGCNNCSVLNPATYVVYSFATGSPADNTLKDPLWYASKYGGFKNSGGAKDTTFLVDKPDIDSEWTNKPDKSPDNYFLVTNPGGLEASLKAVLDDITAKTTSGTAAAVVANTVEGQGAVYQALFEPKRVENSTGKAVKWIGTLYGLFVDANGNLREDGNGNGLLDASLATDPKVQIYYDAVARATKLSRDRGSGFVGNLSLDSLQPIWNARKQLASMSDVSTQRAYQTAATGTSASSGRYIFTFLDANRNGIADAGEVVDFVPASFTSNNFGILNATTATDAAKLVNWVRGVDDTATPLRNRTLDYYNTGTPAGEQVQRLGDIVNSTPTVVSTPQERFDLFYNDRTYTTFRQTYRNRRTVVYVGANDGMLHAFNGGFYDAASKGFMTAPASTTNPSPSPVRSVSQITTSQAHPLGAEIWAYVPFNLLPQLTWMSDPAYGHSWYMDAKPRVFDARIFPNDATHPDGWGTVLVAGMRFGGAQITLNSALCAPTSCLSSFGVAGGTTMTNKPKSAYVIMDVTDPEQPPTLIAEITDASLGFTTSYPTAMGFSQRGNKASSGTNAVNVMNGVASIADKWYLVFGSGPAALPANYGAGNTTATAKLYLWDLRNKAGLTSCTSSAASCYPYDLGSGNFGNMFVGDPVAVDWDLDFKNDALYFGTIGSDPASTGSFVKLNLQDSSATGTADASQWAFTAPFVTGLNRPVVATPTVSQDDAGCRWIMAGTGRFYQKNDKISSTTQDLFGVMDSTFSSTTGLCSPTTNANSAVAFGSLLDVSNITITQGGTVTGGPAGVTTEATLVDNPSGTGTRNVRGWKRSLAAGSPSERSVTRTSLLADVLFASVFTPSTNQCGDGTSRLFGVFYQTGVPKAGLISPPFMGGSTPSDSTVLSATMDLGTGLAAAPGLHLGQLDQANPQETVITQTSTGAISTTQFKIKHIQSGQIDWRGTHR